MNYRNIDDQIAVAPQISIADLEAAKEEGFQLVIANRPDAEEPGQPSMDEIEAKAKELGLQFLHIPIHSGQFTPEAVQQMQDALQNGLKTLAFCRSGTRSAGLWALASAGQIPSDEILRRTSEAGYDFSALAPHLRTIEGQL